MLSCSATRRLEGALRFLCLLVMGTVLLYPLLWMLGGSFQSNRDLFETLNPIPLHPTLDGYRAAFDDYGGQINLLRAMKNTFCVVIPKVAASLVSCLLTAYGFARFSFRGKRLCFALLMSTLFLPQAVMNVPQFLLFHKLGWVDAPWYPALIVPALFAFDTYFVFLLIQFLRGVPTELDDAAKIDGCGSLGILCRILVPMLRPALVSCALLQFLWSSNDYMGPLLYINTPARYTASVFVKLSMDADTGFAWNRVLAVSLLSLLPSVLVFFLSQRSFTEGIAAGGLKE